MAKDKFDWKGLFVNTKEGSSTKKDENEKVTISESAPTTFPESKPISSFPAENPKGTVSSAVLDSIVDMYESGFDSLNQPGYDFYEFFKAIKAVGSNDPAMYKMALTMAQSVDTKVSKTTLLTQAGYYVTEIDKVHKQYLEQGTSKKNSVQQSLLDKKDSVSKEITSMEKQILELQTNISTLKNELQNLDGTLLNEVAEIDQKVNANNIAKAKILETIQSVIDGIDKNL